MVRVDLKTDYAPFVEFDAVRMQVGDSDLAFRADHVVAAGENYLRGQRINETSVQPGEHPITVTLFSQGEIVATRRVSAIVQAAITIVTVVLTRNCEGVMCPNDNPALESCLGGRCVDPRCTPETPEFCPPAQCTSASECAVPDAACVESRCEEGVCLAVPNDTLCETGEACHGVRGCIADVPRDAGTPDASMPDAAMPDAGTPDVFDAGAPDVFDGGPDAGPPDVGVDAGPPTACDLPDGDTLFLFTFDNVMDSVSGRSGVADNSALVSGDSPCGGNVLQISASTSPVASHFRVPDRASFDLTTGSLDFYAKMPAVPRQRDLIGRDSNGLDLGHFTLSVSDTNELVIRSQSDVEEYYTCSSPITPNTWQRIGVNFGVGGVELWLDGVRQQRSGTTTLRGAVRMCHTGANTLDLAGNDNPFVSGAVQIFRSEGTHLPLSEPYEGLELDQLRLSTVRRDYENEIRP